MNVDISDVLVTGSKGGAGIYQDAGSNGLPTGRMDRVNITYNYGEPSTGRGGGYIAYGHTQMNDCRVMHNTVQTEGAGIVLVVGASLVMNGGWIANNTANLYNGASYGNGGALMSYAGAADFTLVNVVIEDNVAKGYGGMAYLSAAGTFNLTNCMVSGNIGVTSCGCLYRGYDTPSCDNSFC